MGRWKIAEPMRNVMVENQRDEMEGIPCSLTSIYSSVWDPNTRIPDYNVPLRGAYVRRNNIIRRSIAVKVHI